MRRPCILLPALAALLAVTACQRGPRTYTDPAKTIHARVGTRFRISLPSRGHVGVRWLLADSAAIAPLELVYAGPPPARRNPRLGGRGRAVWVFHPARPGEATVSLIEVLHAGTTNVPDTTRFRVVVE